MFLIEFLIYLFYIQDEGSKGYNGTNVFLF